MVTLQILEDVNLIITNKYNIKVRCLFFSFLFCTHVLMYTTVSLSNDLELHIF